MALLSAALAAQAPAFTDQYTQRVGGAAQELGEVRAAFERQAKDAGLSTAQALGRLTGAEDGFVAGHGQDITATLSRAAWLAEHHAALTRPGPFRRFAAFGQGADPALIEGTWDDYRPAIPSTPEGFGFAATGFLLIYLIPRLRRARRSRRV